MSEPSFYVLSESQTNDFSSHDTSRAGFHHQDLAAFSEDVNNVRIASAWQRYKQSLMSSRLPRGLFQTTDDLDMKRSTSASYDGRTTSSAFNENLVL